MTKTGKTAVEVVKAAVTGRTTPQLFALLDEINTKPKAQEERLVAAAIADVIEARHNLGDAMDEIYADVDYAGTYTEALRKAMAAAE